MQILIALTLSVLVAKNQALPNAKNQILTDHDVETSEVLANGTSNLGNIANSFSGTVIDFSKMVLGATNGKKSFCYKTAPLADNYMPKHNYKNVTATSAANCLDNCWASAFCRAVLYFPHPETAADKMDNCRLSYQTKPTCDQQSISISQESQSAYLMYCLKKSDDKNNC